MNPLGCLNGYKAYCGAALLLVGALDAYLHFLPADVASSVVLAGLGMLGIGLRHAIAKGKPPDRPSYKLNVLPLVLAAGLVGGSGLPAQTPGVSGKCCTRDCLCEFVHWWCPCETCDCRKLETCQARADCPT